MAWVSNSFSGAWEVSSNNIDTTVCLEKSPLRHLFLYRYDSCESDGESGQWRVLWQDFPYELVLMQATEENSIFQHQAPRQNEPSPTSSPRIVWLYLKYQQQIQKRGYSQKLSFPPLLPSHHIPEKWSQVSHIMKVFLNLFKRKINLN